MKTKRDLRQIGFFQVVRIIFSTIGFELSILIKTFFSRLSLWWQRIYLRKDEFHSSLDLNYDAYATMTRKQQGKYEEDLFNRRAKAHKKDMESTETKQTKTVSGESASVLLKRAEGAIEDYRKDAESTSKNSKN